VSLISHLHDKPTVHMAGTLAASMNDDRWKDVLKIVCEDIRKPLRPDEYAILFVDGYGAHLKNMTSTLIDLFKQKILLFVYGPNLTRYLAPPDSPHWHGVYKTELRKMLWETRGSGSRREFLQVAARPLAHLTPANAKKAFDAVGISHDLGVLRTARDKLAKELQKKIQATEAVADYVAENPRACSVLPVKTMLVRTTNRVERRQAKEERHRKSDVPHLGLLNGQESIASLKRRLAEAPAPDRKIAAIAERASAPPSVGAKIVHAKAKSGSLAKVKGSAHKHVDRARKKARAVRRSARGAGGSSHRVHVRTRRPGTAAPELNPLSRSTFLFY